MQWDICLMKRIKKLTNILIDDELNELIMQMLMKVFVLKLIGCLFILDETLKLRIKTLLIYRNICFVSIFKVLDSLK